MTFVISINKVTLRFILRNRFAFWQSSVRTTYGILRFVDRSSLYNLVNKANLVHNFS